MKFATAKEIQEYLYKKLGLAERSVTFHIIDDQYIGGGILSYPIDYIDSDAVDNLCNDQWDTEFVCFWSSSWMIGDGESDSARWDDIDVLAEVMNDNPELFNDFLRDYAECLVSEEEHEYVRNPYCEEYEDEETEEDDEEEGEW